MDFCVMTCFWLLCFLVLYLVLAVNTARSNVERPGSGSWDVSSSSRSERSVGARPKWRCTRSSVRRSCSKDNFLWRQGRPVSQDAVPESTPAGRGSRR
ncbi:hypothetical protein B0H21DRAFT_323840 [Amylocystis lapponica]|nr:hypothetical protein B0H21DRAFT_323840 [Amylocystis lapponica]